MRKGLGTLLRALVEQLDDAVQARYRAVGLDYRPRFTPVVRYLAEHRAASLRALAAAADVSHSAMSQTIAEMNRLGLVTKQTGSDAREQLVALSGAGKAMLPELEVCWRQTDAAARRLSADVGCDLELVIAEALRQLEQQSFDQRIAAEGGEQRPEPLSV